MKIQKRPLVICLAVPLATGGLAALLTRSGMDVFETLSKPPLSPPGWLFPAVWTILYILMGVASWFIAVSESPRPVTDRALWVYGLQLMFNFFWPVFFFKLSMYLFAFVWLVILWILVLLTAVRFYRIRPAAGYLLIPYLLWVAFAGYLNLGICALN